MGSNHFSIRVVFFFVLWPTISPNRTTNSITLIHIEFLKILLKESNCYFKEIVAIKKINHKDL